jgi:hypothetical protein
MTTIELKDILIHKIAAINDKSFLAAVNTIVDSKSENLIYRTTPEQRERIKKGQEQFLRGETISNDQVEAEIEKWLKEK